MTTPIQGRWRWEDSAGLDHHCGTCGTVLSSPRAMNTCFGKHVEPCRRYHQQLHFIQKSHECFGCSNADEMHIKRHKEIANVVQLIKKHDDENALAQSSSYRKKNRPIPLIHDSDVVSDSLSQHSSADQEPLTKKQRKDAKKSTKNTAKHKLSYESVSKEELDFISEAIHRKIVTGKGSNFLEEGHDLIAQGEVKGITPEILQDNIGFNKFQRNKFYGKRNRMIEEAKLNAVRGAGVLKRSVSKTEPSMPKIAVGSDADTLANFDPMILDRLGIRVQVVHDGSKKRKTMIKKLVSGIQADLEVIDREENEVRIREGGFWRFVNKNTLVNMRELHEGFSWVTGELVKAKKPPKLPEVEADGGLPIPPVEELIIPETLEATPSLYPDQFPANKATPKVPQTPAYMLSAPKKQLLDLDTTSHNIPQHDTPRSMPEYDAGSIDAMIWADPEEPELVVNRILKKPNTSANTHISAPYSDLYGYRRHGVNIFDILDPQEEPRKALEFIDPNAMEPPQSPGWTTVAKARGIKKHTGYVRSTR